MPGRDPAGALGGSENTGRRRKARINWARPELSAGSGGIWTKWRSSAAEVPTYRLRSGCVSRGAQYPSMTLKTHPDSQRR